jgi:gliding motility-associated-like protein
MPSLMKQFLQIILILLCFYSSVKAAHIIGGEMRYSYVGPGISPNSKIFTIHLRLLKGDATGPNVAGLDPFYIISIYNDNGQKFIGPENGTGYTDNWRVTQIAPPGVLAVPILLPTCITGAPQLNYTYADYSLTVELPNTANGYTAVFQSCCRISGLANVGNSVGSTYSCIIPGTNQIANSGDNCPQFGLPINVICRTSPFILNFSATDVDPNDSLVYNFCNAYNGGASTGSPFNNPAPPPFISVAYTSPYTSGNPFGSNATINPQTGIITGIAPEMGKYVVCVCINVYRNGILIGNHRKDLIVQVSDCTVTTANANLKAVYCDTSNVQFSHTSSGANSVFWDFGVLSTLNDTSNIDNPTFNYPDTGLYDIKLVINRGTGCADSIIKRIGVYPGFKPGFKYIGSCYTNPYLFQDTTSTNSNGVVTNWSWNFGDLSTLADTSHIRNPQWIYPAPGPVNVVLTVGSSKGCTATINQTITILDKSPLSLAFKDTLICIPDAVTLNATGPGVFTWTPNIAITNANTATPTVNPTTTTRYYVNQNDNGCVNNDSVLIRVVSVVTQSIMPDTTICQGDTIQLRILSDALSYSWTPAANLNNATIKNPLAVTNSTTTYQVTGSIGSCQATSQVTVTPVPYPKANAGIDPKICYNSSVQLNASIIGTSFVWTPPNYLNNPSVLNPIATPPRTTQYILSAFDNLGCPKPGNDTVTVFVNPRVRAYAGRDTIVVVNQPLQFNGSGGVNYLWSPATGLNSSVINNPIGIYNASIDSVRYKLIVTDTIGCADSAYVTVKVFKTAPSVFVPSGFTPNNDGLNDTIYPIAVGIQKINYFSVFNRWGQLVFKTTADRHGWDGNINGKPQGTGVYVWTVSALDYLGNTIFLKGTVTLIR